jgi:hypothetical protein
MAAAVADDPVEAPALPGLHGGFVHPASPHAGALFVQGTLDGRRLDDVVGPGWRLVTAGIDPDVLDEGLVGWFASIGGRIVALDDPDATLRTWFADHATAAALQRPDLHLYGTATSADEVADLLHHLRHHLAHPLQETPT